ncbi:integrase arm-type DNA-binding domain-containing protein [Sphingomonas sp. LR60]|uniref:tyrosine-type recombinase/integrase n=1 Tax=Sphingomonas sp. LR60 TaxID=3050233 RepID=UPI002FE10A07
MGKLTALAVKNAKAGRHGDGAGLYLLVSSTGAKSWMIRIQQNGKRRDIGLGSVAALSLSEARQRAVDLRKHALNGRDPIAERDRDKRATPTFKEAVRSTHAALKKGWVEKNAAAFLTSLETYAYPTLGNLQVDTIEAGHIRDMLEPIWTTKPELARKVRTRVGQVLNFSHSKGWRATEAPGRSITVGLSKQPAGKNFKAMPYAAVPAFVQSLREKAATVGRQALLFQILTAARPGEVRAARWGQIDVEGRDWNRPAETMKGGEAHTVTLNSAALALLEEVREGALRSRTN